MKIHDRSLSPELDILPSKKAKIVNVYGSPKKLAISTQIIPTDPSSKEVFTILSSNNSATVSSFRPQVKWNEKEIDQLKKLKASEPNRPFYDIAMLIGNGKTVAQCKVKWAEISNRMIEASEGGNLIRRNTGTSVSSPFAAPSPKNNSDKFLQQSIVVRYNHVIINSIPRIQKDQCLRRSRGNRKDRCFKSQLPLRNQIHLLESLQQDFMHLIILCLSHQELF